MGVSDIESENTVEKYASQASLLTIKCSVTDLISSDPKEITLATFKASREPTMDYGIMLFIKYTYTKILLITRSVELQFTKLVTFRRFILSEFFEFFFFVMIFYFMRFDIQICDAILY